MSQMEKIIVKDKAALDEIYKDSSLTIEGLAASDENLAQFKEWISHHTAFKKETFYVIAGKLMNEVYHLTGTNAYPDENCTLVCVMLKDLVNPNALVRPRFHIGGRWFDDVVDNNARREQEKGNI